MKTEQEQIEEIAFSSCVVPHKTVQFLSNYMRKESIKFESCRVCEFYNSCQRIKDIKSFYKAGYRKASDVIDELVKRIKERALHSCREIINCYKVTRIETVIDDIAAEMRQEVEK